MTKENKTRLIKFLWNLASFDGESSSWLDKVAYVGAFNATDNWLTGWTNFDPQNTKY